MGNNFRTTIGFSQRNSRRSIFAKNKKSDLEVLITLIVVIIFLLILLVPYFLLPRSAQITTKARKGNISDKIPTLKRVEKVEQTNKAPSLKLITTGSLLQPGKTSATALDNASLSDKDPTLNSTNYATTSSVQVVENKKPLATNNQAVAASLVPADYSVNAEVCAANYSSCVVSITAGSSNGVFLYNPQSKTFSTDNYPPTANFLISFLSCPNYPLCFGAGLGQGYTTYPIFASNYSGSWQAVYGWFSFSAVSALSCINSQYCLIIENGTLLYTSNAGASWQPPSLPQNSAGSPGSLSCANSLCYLLNFIQESNSQFTLSVLESPNGGQSFDSPVNENISVISVTSFTCFDTFSCIVLANVQNAQNIVINFNLEIGKTSAEEFGPDIGQLNTMSCSTASFCALGGSDKNNSPDIIYTLDQGLYWFKFNLLTSPPYSFVSSLACYALLKCLVVLGSGYQLQNQFLLLTFDNLQNQELVPQRILQVLPVKYFQTPLSLSVTGDSIAASIQFGMQIYSFTFNSNVTPDYGVGFGCGLISSGICLVWQKSFTGTYRDHLSIALIEVGIWDTGGTSINGNTENFGDLQFDTLWKAHYEEVLRDYLKAGITPIAISMLYDEFTPKSYIDIANTLIDEAVSNVPGAYFYNLNSLLYPNSNFTYVINGYILKADSRHFPSVGSSIIAPYLYDFASKIIPN